MGGERSGGDAGVGASGGAMGGAGGSSSATGGAGGMPTSVCQPNPCEHDGQCVAFEPDPRGYACNCGPGTTGDHCERLELQGVDAVPQHLCSQPWLFPTALSGDGRVVWCACSSPQGAFLWTPGGRPTLMLRDAYPSALSRDGSVVVGYFPMQRFDDVASGFRFTFENGREQLPDRLVAYATDDSGTVVVGDASGVAARWTASEGTQPLGLPSGWELSSADATSGDGSVVVVNARNESDVGSARAFRWTRGSGLVELGLPLGAEAAFAWGISADGSTNRGARHLPRRGEGISLDSGVRHGRSGSAARRFGERGHRYERRRLGGRRLVPAASRRLGRIHLGRGARRAFVGRGFPRGWSGRWRVDARSRISTVAWSPFPTTVKSYSATGRIRPACRDPGWRGCPSENQLGVDAARVADTPVLVNDDGVGRELRAQEPGKAPVVVGKQWKRVAATFRLQRVALRIPRRLRSSRGSSRHRGSRTRCEPLRVGARARACTDSPPSRRRTP